MKGFVKDSIISTKFFIKDNTLIIVFITLFTVGTAVGALSPGLLGDKSSVIIKLLKSFFSENETLSVMTLFSRNLVSSFIYLGVMYVAGLCAIGLPVIGVIPILKGLSIGVIVAYQYIFNGLKGFLYTLAIIVVPNAVFITLLNYAYAEGIYMSLNVSNGIFNGKPRETKYDCNFMTFTKRFLIFAVASVAVSLFEAAMTSVFSKVI